MGVLVGVAVVVVGVLAAVAVTVVLVVWILISVRNSIPPIPVRVLLIGP